MYIENDEKEEEVTRRIIKIGATYCCSLFKPSAMCTRSSSETANERERERGTSAEDLRTNITYALVCTV